MYTNSVNTNIAYMCTIQSISVHIYPSLSLRKSFLIQRPSHPSHSHHHIIIKHHHLNERVIPHKKNTLFFSLSLVILCAHISLTL